MKVAPLRRYLLLAAAIAMSACGGGGDPEEYPEAPAVLVPAVKC